MVKKLPWAQAFVRCLGGPLSVAEPGKHHDRQDVNPIPACSRAVRA